MPDLTKILVVDDDGHIRKLLFLALRGEGFEPAMAKI